MRLEQFESKSGRSGNSTCRIDLIHPFETWVSVSRGRRQRRPRARQAKKPLLTWPRVTPASSIVPPPESTSRAEPEPSAAVPNV